MANKAGTTTAVSTVTESGTNALITIPANGYYSTSSKISVPISTIQNNVTETIKSVTGVSVNANISGTSGNISACDSMIIKIGGSNFPNVFMGPYNRADGNKTGLSTKFYGTWDGSSLQTWTITFNVSWTTNTLTVTSDTSGGMSLTAFCV